MRFPGAVREKFSESMITLNKRFNPDSKRELYVAELHSRKRRKDEDWASFGDALKVLADKAYGDLEDKARERLALNQFLTEIGNPQVAFGVKQKGPKTVEDAVIATIELETYLTIVGRSPTFAYCRKVGYQTRTVFVQAATGIAVQSECSISMRAIIT